MIVFVHRALVSMLCVCAFGLAVPKAAWAALEVDITQGVVQPMPLAVTDFDVGETPDPQQIGKQMAEVIRADLERSGLFRSLNPEAFVEQSPSVDVQPRFVDWRAIKAQALINGRVQILDDNRMQVEFRLWDVYAGQQMVGLQFAARTESWRRIAHKIADAVYERITGESGYFDTRIVFIAESGGRAKRVKRLAIMDQDGANLTYLTDGSYTVLTPRFSPTQQQITYMSYRGGVPRVYLFDIETGRQEAIQSGNRMTFAPRFSPDGKAVVYSQEQGGDSDVFLMDLRSHKRVQLTRSPAIDTSPSFSPDGKRIVFNSDRGGSPQLYVMNIDGSGVKRISFGSGSYMTPVWSPRGDLIAFTKQRAGKFHIGVMRPDGSGERILTTSYLDEGPTWAPNGRVLMFFRENPGGDPYLMQVDLTGKNLQRVKGVGGASDPAWSPLLN